MIFQTITTDRKFLNTGYKVSATKVRGVYNYWDVAKQRVKPGAENCDEVNEYLNLQETNFREFLKDCKSREKRVKIEELINLLSGEKKVLKKEQNRIT